MRSNHFRLAATAALVAMLSSTAANAAASLTILHNNDGESKVLPVLVAGQPYAGAARFVTALEQQRAQAIGANRDVVTISSGDNFLAGTVFTASLKANTFYDARVLNAINYDAVLLGNHEFDFGPQVLANFIGQATGVSKFLSANLDFSGEASLQALVNQGKIAKSTVVTKNGQQYGIVGATTTDIAFIAQPGNVGINPVAAAVQAEIDTMVSNGVNKIIYAGHLQNPLTDVQTLAQLRGVDVYIAGGYDPYLTNGGPSPDVFGQARFGPYPATQFNGTNFTGGANIVDADGKVIPVISTAGEYRYVGRADVEFDDNGVVTSINGGPVLVTPSFAENPGIVSQVIQPVQQALAALAANIVAVSEVPLNALNADIRTRETNLGSLVADSFIYEARKLDQQQPDLLDGANVTLALTNGGGIRTNQITPAGNISELRTLDILAFDNFLSVFKDVTAQQIKALLEFSVGAIPVANGRFGQIAGFSFVYNPAAPVGQRIVEIRLPSSEFIFQNGVFTDELFNLVTINFLANGGDNYPFRALGLTEFETTTSTYQQALLNFLVDGLDGRITAADYPVGGLGRIRTGVAAAVPEPGAFGVLGLALAGLVALRRRRAA